MSSYINFFVERNGVYIPVAEYSRSNPIYSALSDIAPYEKMIELDEKSYNEGIANFNRAIENFKYMISIDEKEIEDARSIEAPIQEKLQAIYEIRSDIRGAEEELDLVESQKAQFQFLYYMRDEWSKVKVYFGIEVGDPGYPEE